MNVLVVADGHYYQTPDGSVYADSIYDYHFYKRYLSVFDHIIAVVRATDVNEVPAGKQQSSGEGISFFRLPSYQGPYEYIKKYLAIRKSVSHICGNADIDCAILRIPAATSNIICSQFSKTKKPFAVEVVADPWENFSPRTAGNKLMLWFVRRQWTALVRKMCNKAIGASYVTETYLQGKYPPRAYSDKLSLSFTSFYSSVELKDGSYGIPKTWAKYQDSFIISHVSNYFSGYGKGHIILMRALKIVRDKGYNVKLQFIGDGPKREEFEKYAESLNIRESVTFLGRLANGDEVRKVISNSDLFVLPTYAEGLPRVLLEAMAEGIPCLSSPVCGIPEILDDELLYDFDDYSGFADGIIKLITDPNKLSQCSSRNIVTAKKYSSSILNKRRTEFYQKLKDYTSMVSHR